MREQPATDLAIATRILSRSGAIGAEGRVTVRLRDVVYVASRGTSLATMTPYDVCVVLLADGSALHGDPPEGLAAYLAAHRRAPHAGSVACASDGTYVAAHTLRACVVAVLRHARGEEGSNDDATIERAWLDLVAQARISGALIGAFPTEPEG